MPARSSVYLIIRKSDHTVFQAQFTRPPTGMFPKDVFEVKEWTGPVPLIHTPEEGIYSYDPTLTDPGYNDYLAARGHFDELADKASIEIEWLEQTIPLIPIMTGAEVRDVVKRLAQENLRQIKAWRYIFRRLN